MMVVGLTGGIGSGKTTVAKMFRTLKVPVYNSDKEAKRLMKSSKKLRKAIMELLGEKAYDGKKLNRSYISNAVFNNKELLEKLNAIVHPAVRKHFRSWAKKNDAPYVIQEAAIIFENALQGNYDKIILVTAPEEVRIKRVMDRDETTRKKILQRMGNQWTDSEKIDHSDFVIENIHLETTQKQVQKIHGQLLEIVD